MNTKEYTFQNLFGSSFDFEGIDIVLKKIEIPIIQRDYAQGRKNDEVGRIRERFLDAIFQSIKNNKQITLDFVYGDVSKEGVLTPLDGQQRLTTLFLLHWYIAKKEKLDISKYEFLNHFSYATRFSSRDFCCELINYSPDFSTINLSETIKDQAWYPYEWKNDSTIQSMLVMIDAIHEKFNNHLDLWKSLVIDNKINFYFLPLSEMGLTDDLYIKMNSRGKPLSQFEHFKAEFEEIIKQNSDELSKEINHKVDIEWADILFPFRGDNNVIDDEFMRYFRFIGDIICYKSEIDFEKDEFKLANLLYGLENERAKENIEYLINSFDCWHKLDIKEFFNKFFSNNTYEKDKVKLYQDDLNIFKECCENYGEYNGRNRKFPLNKILLLFSINTYLQNTDKVTEIEFRNRIRIIRNLIWNSSDEIRDDRMKILLFESETIIISGKIPFSERGDLGYNAKQKDEERNKLEWLKTNPQNKNELFHLEDHILLRGCIAVVSLNNIENFIKFRLLFDNCSKDKIDRALLSIGDYTQSISDRFFTGYKNNWITLFHPSKQLFGFEQRTTFILNKLLQNLNISEITDEKLDNIITNYLTDNDKQRDWRYYFVKYHKSLNRDGDGYYIFNDNEYGYDIIKLNRYQLNGMNWNIYAYLLYVENENYLSLGNYSNQGDKLKIKNSSFELECLVDKYILIQNEISTEYQIKQMEGIDIEDRIEKGTNIILDIIKTT